MNNATAHPWTGLIQLPFLNHTPGEGRYECQQGWCLLPAFYHFELSDGINAPQRLMLCARCGLEIAKRIGVTLRPQRLVITFGPDPDYDVERIVKLDVIIEGG